MDYFIFSSLIVILIATGIQSVQGQVNNQTLSNSTISSIVHQFNPLNQPISTDSYTSPSGCTMPQFNNTIGSINKIKCGLYAFDPLNNKTLTQQQLQANATYWTYGGDAPGENASFSYFEDMQGLHLGIKAPSNGTYAGYYAVTPKTNAMLFHAVISSPVNTVPYGEFQNGLYVQTTQAPVNYVTCVSITSNLGTLWAIVHTYGSPYGSLVFDPLWVDTSANQPLTRDCTIITNGHNYLKVYLDGNMVYRSNTLVLAMPAPFNAFLEVQSSYDGQNLFGIYSDFYATLGENVNLIHNPSSASTAKVIDNSGNTLASAPIILGNATIEVGKYHFPSNASIDLFNSSNGLIASSPVLETVYGGDVYSTITNSNKTLPSP